MPKCILFNIANGTYETSQTRIGFGNNVTFKCIGNMIVTGTNQSGIQLTCSDNGKLSTIPKCARKLQ